MAISVDSSVNAVDVISGGATHSIEEVRVIQGGVTTTVWTANPKIILSDVLQSGISRSVIESYGVSVTYPSETSVTLQTQGYYDDGETDIDACCVMRYDKPIKGNGKTLYVQSQMYNTGYAELADCQWDIQLVDVTTGAVTTLATYADTVDWNAFTAQNNVLTAYTLPTSGTYYFQVRYWAHGYGQATRYINCYLHNVYVA